MSGYGAGSAGVLGTIGGTPLVELTRLLPGSGFRVHAKLEAANPGGSIKDRSAYAMLTEAVRTGAVVPGRSVVVESSSGNLGIGLAQVCRILELRFICVVDPRTNPQNIAIMRAYGAEVHTVTDRDPATGEYLPMRRRRVRELLATLPDAYCPNQYGNPRNAWAHRGTMREIVEALDGELDFLLCTVSSAGTLRGCAEYAREHGLGVRIIAVDAESSAIFHTPVGNRLIPGHGAAVRPELFRPGLADEVVHVNDLDCVVGCRRLAVREAILAGGSSGAVVSALHRLRERIPAGANCALILPDRGERYLDTIYDDDWVAAQFGDVTELWKDDAMEVARC
ncbi:MULTISPECIES: 2,3-diaminopropionate biosynthesis protein SbnA [unclassified Crossiella]|uniref:2,3-diaminopropionate biosynthesis protein SbnA n=1 Tax=unclassified Crossiella TaxID=2620835 RepID=UPI0020001117|nr:MULTISPECIES: 2,3-diaminopropionate biosynthesis protein SbnA [unclassified Crossiella]MCK2241496.1 2,3-diaminopropionate biosynthesis protein SbnA [Crossiella sp. S99.2]MCK2255632.1 2,3-diaminopropionate biosynthesis protein SbnA [Crossiella sp. S99.1]